MTQTLLRLFVALMMCAFVGCASRNKKPKSSVHIYEGEAPTIRYSDEPEAAGGSLNSY